MESAEKKILLINNNECIKDKSSNLNSLTKEYFPKKEIKNNPYKIKQLLPSLNQIKIKFTKRENIDKKIMKLLKNFIKVNIKKKNQNFLNEIKNVGFWNRFIQGMYTPPFKIVDDSTNENLEFKSMNSFYLVWIFQNDFATEIYKLFLKEKSNVLLDSFIEYFNLKESDDIKTLKYYIYNFHKIFSLDNSKNKF